MNTTTNTKRTGSAAELAGQFRYVSSRVEPSLWRNNQVMIRRDADGNTAESRGLDLESHLMRVRNARLLKDNMAPTCEANGFELLVDSLEGSGLALTSKASEASVVGDYYQHCASIVSRATGARAYPFDHNVRSAGGKQDGRQITGGQHVQEPAHIVHGDYTLRSAPERLAQLGRPPSGNDTLRGVLAPGQSLIPADVVQRVQREESRFAIINLWRNIDEAPVATHPLALCDAQSVEPEDLVVFEIHYADRIGENYFARFSSRHQMYCYPAMTREEALLIKQWDSAGPLARSNGREGDARNPGAPCTFSFHSAFAQPDAPADAPDRWSIEVRCLVVYD